MNMGGCLAGFKNDFVQKRENAGCLLLCKKYIYIFKTCDLICYAQRTSIFWRHNKKMDKSIETQYNDQWALNFDVLSLSLPPFSENW